MMIDDDDYCDVFVCGEERRFLGVRIECREHVFRVEIDKTVKTATVFILYQGHHKVL